MVINIIGITITDAFKNVFIAKLKFRHKCFSGRNQCTEALESAGFLREKIPVNISTVAT